MQFIHNLYIMRLIGPYVRNIASNKCYEKLSAISCKSLKDKIQITNFFNSQERLRNKTFYFCTKHAF